MENINRFLWTLKLKSSINKVEGPINLFFHWRLIRGASTTTSTNDEIKNVTARSQFTQ